MKQVHRYNIFKRTHKGLRSMLFNAGAKIQHTDFTKQRQAAYTINSIKQTTLSFTYHINKEDSIVYHAVALEAPYIIAMIEKTNKKDVALAQSISELILTYDKLNTKKEKIAFGFELQAAFFEFTASVLQHINKEEAVINELLWDKFSDHELAALEMEIMKKVTPDDCTWYTGSIMKGLSNEEIITWIGGLTEYSSQIMIEKLIRTARKVLPTEQWHMIRGKITGDKIAA